MVASADSQTLPLTRLTWVTGKGGVGKSTVAAALARCCADRAERTLLVECLRAGDRSAVFGVPLQVEPRVVSGSLSVMRLDGLQGLKTWVRRRSTLGALYAPMLESPAVQRFLDALPGFEELLTLGQLYDLCTGDRSPFGRVIVDAPATGHFRNLLRVPGTVIDTLKSGPVRENTQRIKDLLADEARCRVIALATPEEAPLTEAVEVSHLLEEVSMTPACTLVNQRRVGQFRDVELESLEQARWPRGSDWTKKVLLERERRAMAEDATLARFSGELNVVGSLPLVAVADGGAPPLPEQVADELMPRLRALLDGMPA